MMIKQLNFNKINLFLLISIISLFILKVAPTHIFSFYNTGEILFASDYDSQNIIAWQYARYLDMIPYSDIWYPYGGRYFVNSPFPPDIFYYWIILSISFSCFIFSIYFLLDKSIIKLLFFLSLIAWADYSGAINFISRYCFLFIFFLLFVSGIYTKKKIIIALSGLYGGLLFFLEPPVAVVGIFSITLFLFVITYFNKPLKNNLYFKFIISSYLIFILFGALSLIPYLIYLIQTNSFYDFLNFYLTLTDMSTGSSWPIITSQLKGLSYDFTLFFLTSALAGYILLMFPYKNDKENKFWISLSIGILSSLILLLSKYVIRPHMAGQIFYFPIFYFLFLYIKKINFDSLRFNNIAFIAIISFISLNLFLMILPNSTYKFNALVNNFSLLFHDTNTYKKKYFDSSNFNLNGLNGSELRKNLINKEPGLSFEEFYFMGDEPYLYILFDKRPFKYVSFYNTSPIYDQLSLSENLEEKKPQYVLWRPDFKVFDVVPNQIRLPILFKYISKNYSYKSTVDGFDILERRENVGSPDFRYWSEKLGTSTDFKKLFQFKSTPEKCPSNTICDLQLQISRKDGQNFKEKSVEIIFNIDNEFHHKVIFEPNKRDKILLINISNLWFWDKALFRENKLTIDISSSYNAVITDLFLSNKKALY